MMNRIYVLKNQHKVEHKAFICISLLVLEKAYEVAEYYVNNDCYDDDYDGTPIVNISLRKGHEYVHIEVLKNNTIVLEGDDAQEIVECYNILHENMDILNEPEKDVEDVEYEVLEEQSQPCVSQVKVKRRSIVWDLIKKAKKSIEQMVTN